jgi:Domain of unknown function (DUF4402)
MNKLLIIAIVLIGFTVNSFAQATANATATATIISAITIAKVTDMNFGNASVSSVGTVLLATNGTRTVTGGVTLPSVAGTVSAASFNVTGQGTSTYSISLPVSAHTITRTSGAETMTVSGFVSSPSGTGTLVAGAQTINVGAVLGVAAGQVAGVYTNATGFNVTVNYN